MRRRKHPEQVAQTIAGDGRVEVVRIDNAARLLTYRDDDAPEGELVKGAIVRVVPDGDSTGTDRADLRAFLLANGATHVWFAPRAAAPEVVSPERGSQERPEEPPRVVIARMVDEAHTRDRERLRVVIEEAITPEGL